MFFTNYGAPNGTLSVLYKIQFCRNKIIFVLHNYVIQTCFMRTSFLSCRYANINLFAYKIDFCDTKMTGVTKMNFVTQN